MKPSIAGSEGMIIEAVKNDLVPVSYDYLRQFPETFKSCCVCYDQNGSPHCPDRDTSCVLGVDASSAGAPEATLHFVSSAAFSEAVPNPEMRAKITLISTLCK